MDTDLVARIEDWEERPVQGIGGLHALADAEFSGAARTGRNWLFLSRGRPVAAEGRIEAFEGAEATAFVAPDPGVSLLTALRAVGGEPRARKYTEDDPLREADRTLSSGGFTGYLELSENVLSGDYYLVYYGGESRAVARVGESERLYTGDEARERIEKEVGIYEVVPVDLAPIELPGVEPTDPPRTGGPADRSDDAGADRRPGGGDGATHATRGGDDRRGTAPDVVDDPNGTSTPAAEGTRNDRPGDIDLESAVGDATAGGQADRGASDGRPEDDPRGGEPAESEPRNHGSGREAGTDRDPATNRETTERNAGRANDRGDDRDGGDGRGGTVTDDASDDIAALRERLDSLASRADEPGSDTDRIRGEIDALRSELDRLADDPTPDTSDGNRGSGRDAGGPAGTDGTDGRDSPGERARSGTDGEGRERRAGGAEPSRGTASRDTVDESDAPSGHATGDAGGADHTADGARPGADATPDAGTGDPAMGRRAATDGTGTDDAAGRGPGTRGADGSVVDDTGSAAGDGTGTGPDPDDGRTAIESDRRRADAPVGDGDEGAGGDRSPDEALAGTRLFLRYETKGEATLQEAHDEDADEAIVDGNLRLEYHTDFDAAATTVDGEPFDEFLVGRLEFLVAEWLVRDLLFEIRETDSEAALADLYDAIPRIDRIDVAGTVTVDDPIEVDDGTVDSLAFDLVARDRTGVPLIVVDIHEGRDPVGEETIAGFETAVSALARETGLAAALTVASSYFEPKAVATAEAASGGGLLSRDSREGFVRTSRSSGYHLCLVEFRDGAFHLTVPDL